MRPSQSLLAQYSQTLIPFLLLLLGGAYTAYETAFPLWFWLGWTLVAMLCALLCLTLKGRRTVLLLFLWLAGFLLGGVLFTVGQFQPKQNDIAHWINRPDVNIQGIITRIDSSPAGWVVSVQQADGKTVSGQVLVRKMRITPETQPHIGQVVQLAGELEEPPSALFPGDFDYRKYLRQQRITALMRPKSNQLQNQFSSSPWLRILDGAHHLSQHITGHFQAALPGPEGAIFSSIVLGEHAVGMDVAIKQQFIQSGLIHLLAASGLNVGIIAFSILFIGQKLRLPLRVSMPIAMLGVAFYCLLTGLPPSVQRAGLMLELAFLLKLLRKELTPTLLLCLTGTILVLLNPMTIGMIGFQLSFLSTFGLLTMVRPLQEKLGFYLTNWGAGLLLVPVIAQLWVTPIIWFHFNQVQLLSLPANLMALPIVGTLTNFGFVLGGLSLILPQVSGWLLGWLGWLPTLLHQIASFFAQLPFANITAASPTPVAILAGFGVLALLAFKLNFPERLTHRRTLKAACALLLLMLLPLSLQKWNERSHFSLAIIPNRNQPQSRVFHSPDGTILVSTPGMDYITARNLKTYLNKHGIRRIQALSITHPQPGSLQGLDDFLGQVQTEQMLIPEAMAGRARNRAIQLSQQFLVPLTTVNDTTQMVSGESRGLLYALPDFEIISRLDIGGSCLVWHLNQPYPQEMDQSVQKPCLTLIGETPEESRLQLPYQQNWVRLSGFHIITRHGRQFQVSAP